MRISVFGLGYVGAVTAGHLARRGHTIVGVDVQAQKVEAFNRGEAPIVEPGLAELLQRAKANGLLRATESCAEAVAETDLSLVCVGTPSTVSRRAGPAVRAAGDGADRGRAGVQTGAPHARLPQHHATGRVPRGWSMNSSPGRSLRPWGAPSTTPSSCAKAAPWPTVSIPRWRWSGR